MATLLVITAFLPLVGSLVLFLAPGLDIKAARAIALATVLVTLALQPGPGRQVPGRRPDTAVRLRAGGAAPTG